MLEATTPTHRPTKTNTKTMKSRFKGFVEKQVKFMGEFPYARSKEFNLSHFKSD